jgi:hypothetical protein
MEPTTIESRLFSWQDWDEIETGVFNYTDVVLKIAVGKHPTSTTNEPCWKCEGEGTIGEFKCPTECDKGQVVVPAPEFYAGHTFSHATVDYQQSRITFYDRPDDEVGHCYELTLNVGAKRVG